MKIVIALAAFTAFAAEPAKQEAPKPIVKPITTEQKLAVMEASKAISDLNAELQQEMRQFEGRFRQANERRSAAVAKARVAAGAPDRCDLDDAYEWVEYRMVPAPGGGQQRVARPCFQIQPAEPKK